MTEDVRVRFSARRSCPFTTRYGRSRRPDPRFAGLALSSNFVRLDERTDRISPSVRLIELDHVACVGNLQR